MEHLDTKSTGFRTGHRGLPYNGKKLKYEAKSIE